MNVTVLIIVIVYKTVAEESTQLLFSTIKYKIMDYASVFCRGHWFYGGRFTTDTLIRFNSISRILSFLDLNGNFFHGSKRNHS
jgi:hypothetical protein